MNKSIHPSAVFPQVVPGNKRTDLQVRGEGIRQPHITWEGTKNEVPHLDAVGWNNITERHMVITKELWEVMKQNQQYSQCALKGKERE